MKKTAQTMKPTDVARLLICKEKGKAVLIYIGDYAEACRRFKIWSEDLWDGWSLNVYDRFENLILSFEKEIPDHERTLKI